jgi:hypothetical protein
MSKVFRITPKRIKRVNGLVLTPEMSIVVTTRIHLILPSTMEQRRLKNNTCVCSASTTRKHAVW